MVWAAMASNPILPFADAVRLQLSNNWWLLALMGLELVRQMHFLISEHWAAYHRFWTTGLRRRGPRAHRRLLRLDPVPARPRPEVVLFWIAF